METTCSCSVYSPLPPPDLFLGLLLDLEEGSNMFLGSICGLVPHHAQLQCTSQKMATFIMICLTEKSYINYFRQCMTPSVDNRMDEKSCVTKVVSGIATLVTIVR
jgi:hypothetical protein